jgi:hypothetical protein
MAIHQCPHCELWFMSGSGIEWHLLKSWKPNVGQARLWQRRNHIPSLAASDAR